MEPDARLLSFFAAGSGNSIVYPESKLFSGIKPGNNREHDFPDMQMLFCRKIGRFIRLFFRSMT